MNADWNRLSPTNSVNHRNAGWTQIPSSTLAATKAPAIMWGPSIVGFGHRRLRYPDGREIDWMAVGVSPRKAATTLYLTGGLDEYADLLADLGRHTTGKGCLYVKRLDDVDLKVLTKIVARSVSLAKQG